MKHNVKEIRITHPSEIGPAIESMMADMTVGINTRGDVWDAMSSIHNQLVAVKLELGRTLEPVMLEHVRKDEAIPREAVALMTLHGSLTDLQLELHRGLIKQWDRETDTTPPPLQMWGGIIAHVKECSALFRASQLCAED